MIPHEGRVAGNFPSLKQLMGDRWLPLDKWRMGFKSPLLMILSAPRKKKFKLPLLDTFDAYEDPRDHNQNHLAKMAC